MNDWLAKNYWLALLVIFPAIGGVVKYSAKWATVHAAEVDAQNEADAVAAETQALLRRHAMGDEPSGDDFRHLRARIAGVKSKYRLDDPRLDLFMHELDAIADKADRRVAEAARASLAAAPPTCNAVAALPAEQVAMVGLMQGEGVSTVGIGGDGTTTTVAHLTVEPGSQPLYLVLSSHRPVLWMLQGAVQRVQHVAAFSTMGTTDGKSAAGVTGVAKDKVTLSAPGTCFDGYLAKAPAALPPEHRLVKALGRAPNTSAAFPTADTVAVPSGTAAHARAPATRRDSDATLPAGYNGERWLAALRRFPAGLVAVDPAQVASAAPAAAYRILPEEFGAAQRNGK